VKHLVYILVSSLVFSYELAVVKTYTALFLQCYRIYHFNILISYTAVHDIINLYLKINLSNRYPIIQPVYNATACVFKYVLKTWLGSKSTKDVVKSLGISNDIVQIANDYSMVQLFVMQGHINKSIKLDYLANV